MIIAIDITDASAGVAWSTRAGQGYLPLAGLRPSAALLPALDQCLQMGEPSSIGVVTGPGSFTGIRTGIATVLGLKAAKNIKVVGLNKFELMGFQTPTLRGRVLHILLPGRGDRLFYGRWSNGELQLPPVEVSTKDLPAVDAFIAPTPLDLNQVTVKPINFAQVCLRAMGKGRGDPNLTPLYIRPADTRLSLSLIEKLLSKVEEN